MVQYQGHFDDYGTLDVYEEEPSPGLAAAPLVIYKTVCLFTWFPWVFSSGLIGIFSIIRSICRIRGREKVRSGKYLLIVGILAVIKSAVVTYLMYIGKL